MVELPIDSPAGLVISELRERIDPNRPPMLIGAEARDVLHSGLGHDFKNTATQDVDIAFAIPDWESYAALTDGLDPIPDTGIAFRIAGMHVDVMAFGSVESPQGTVTPPFRKSDPLDVFGMSQVYAAAHEATFGDGLDIRLPTVAGYVALKLEAWIDRSAVHNQKDAPDLGLALYWAAESRAFAERFWGDSDLFSKWEADVGLGGAALLGADVREVLGEDAAGHLAELFTVESRGQLSGALRSSERDLGLGGSDRRLATLEALTNGLRG
jgi:predicted nucleotidyltransferase